MLILGIIEDIGVFLNKFIIGLVTSFFKLVDSAYRIFLQLSKTNIFGEEHYNAIVGNIYKILSIVMLFALAYGILLKIVDPDGSSKGIDGKKFISKFVLSIILIAVIPSIFSFAYGFQGAVLDSQILGGIFTGEVSNSSDENTSDSSLTKYGGITMSVNTFLPFFNVVDPDSVDNVDNFTANEDETLDATAISPDGKSVSISCPTCTYEQVVNFAKQTGSFAGFKVFAKDMYDNKIDFDWFAALLVALFLVYAIISFCFDMGIRICKLAFFQIIAPIAIICNIIPKMDDVFKKWTSNTTKTFISVFTRTFVMNFGVYLISICVKIFEDTKLKPELGSAFLNGLFKCFVIMGIVAFVRQAPKLLSDLFGFGDGDMKLGIKDKLKEGGFFAAGNAVGSLITSRGNPLAFVRGAKYGFKNTDMHHVGAENTRRRQFRHALENSTPGELAIDRLRRMFGFETSKDAADLHIENAVLTIKDKDGNDIKIDAKAIEQLQKNKDTLNTQVSQITDMMRKNQTAKSDNGILIASQDAIKNAAISDLSKSDSEIVEVLSINTGYTEAQRKTDLENLDEIYTRPGSNVTLAEYEERKAAILNRKSMLDLRGNYTSLKEQLETSYKNGLLTNEQYQKASVELAKKQKEMVAKYVTAAATEKQYIDANGTAHDIDKSKKVLSNYKKFYDDLFSEKVVRNEQGELMSKKEIEKLTKDLADGWDIVDNVSKQLGNINFQLDQGTMKNERDKRVFEQQIQEIDGQLDQVAKIKQQEKTSDSYKHKTEATNYNDKYHK